MLSPQSEFEPHEAELLAALRAGRLSRRTFMRYAAGTALVVGVAGCGSTVGSKGAGSGVGKRVGGRISYPLPGAVDTLDPAFSTQWAERTVLKLCYNSLFTYDPNFKIQPGLARSWKFEDGGRQILIQLQPNVKFQDGTACDAHAVKWNLDRLLNPQTNATSSSLVVPPLTAVTVEGSTTVRLHLSKPWRPLLASLADRPGYMASPTAVTKYGKDYGLHPVGTGPFKLESWIPRGNITFKRFPGYWEHGKPYLDELVMMPQMDTSVALSALQSNEVQVITDVSPTLVPTIAGNNNIVMNKIKGGHWYATQYRVDIPPFNNIHLIEAEGYAAYREAVIKTVFANEASIPPGPLVVGIGAPPQGTQVAYPYDLTKAKAAAKAAGADAKQQLVFTTATDFATYSDLTQALLPGYKTAGLNVHVQGTEESTIFAGSESGKYNWTVTNWRPKPDPDQIMRLLFYTGNRENTTRFSDPQVDQWLDEAAQLYNPAQATAIYAKVLDVVTRRGGFDWLAMPSQIAAVRSNVGGLVQNTDGILRLDQLYLTA